MLLLAAMLAGPDASRAETEGTCMSWSEARSKGLIDKHELRPATQIKSSVESRYGGKVVSFVICEGDNGLTYKMAVFREDGNVTFVTEPAQ